LSKEILKIPVFGCLNVHPSLLPKYRGCSPIQTAILKGDKKTGVTIFLMAEKIDQGKIISQKEIKISSNDDYLSLEKKLAKLGSDLLVKTIPKWIKGEIKAKKQTEEKSSYAPPLRKEDGRIDWSKKAEEIERKVRAFRPWPGAFTFWSKSDKKIRLKILSSKVEEKNIESQPGQTKEGENGLLVQCQDKPLLIERMQAEGKPAMSSSDFLKGNPDIKNTILK
jgi:methionyl-tRNA formyltransferase